jgi:hypothetical protein
MSFESLRGLSILVVSPNPWGDMRVSKHHYAEALAKRGNRVFFLNPPASHSHTRIEVETIADVPGLTAVTYRPFLPYSIRFRSRFLFNQIVKAQVRWLLKELNVQFDVVWCFDSNIYSDLRQFRAPLTIFHPVDQISLRYQIDVAASADIVLSVSEEILRRVEARFAPSMRVEHGLAPEFVALAKRQASGEPYQQPDRLRVGYVGNLLMRYVDREILLRLIVEHRNMDFHFWGPRSSAESNLGSEESPQTSEFINTLRSQPNVVLHGVQKPAMLAQQLGGVDLLLMCYAVATDPNRGCNSHKLLEYMSTGRAIVSNHVSDYADRPGLIEMPVANAQPQAITKLFDAVVQNIQLHNGDEPRQRRLQYALDNSYSRQIERIASFAAHVSPVTFQTRNASAPALLGVS